MKSNLKDDKNDFGESSEDSRGFFESSSTLNNETSYKSSSTPSEHTTKERLRSRKMQPQVSICHFSNDEFKRWLTSLMQQTSQITIDPLDDMLDESSSQSDDYENNRCRRKTAFLSSSSSSARRKKGTLNAKERNLRRLESNERERMRMHSLNDAFQVGEIVMNAKSFICVCE
jgi:hypothetical protein